MLVDLFDGGAGAGAMVERKHSAERAGRSQPRYAGLAPRTNRFAEFVTL